MGEGITNKLEQEKTPEQLIAEIEEIESSSAADQEEIKSLSETMLGFAARMEARNRNLVKAIKDLASRLVK